MIDSNLFRYRIGTFIQKVKYKILNSRSEAMNKPRVWLIILVCISVNLKGASLPTKSRPFTDSNPVCICSVEIRPILSFKFSEQAKLETSALLIGLYGVLVKNRSEKSPNQNSYYNVVLISQKTGYKVNSK